MFRSLAGVAAVVLLLPPVAEANWFRSLLAPRAVVVSSYSPQVVYYVPAPPVIVYPSSPVPVMPATPIPALPAAPSSNAPPLAVPQPAPPSAAPILPANPAPPSGNPIPPPGNPTGQSGGILSAEVGESRFYDTYATGGRDTSRMANGRVSVGFWNLTGQDLVFQAGGQRLALPRGRNVTLELDRQFTWQVEGRPALKEQAPAGEPAMAIVIRR